MKHECEGKCWNADTCTANNEGPEGCFMHKPMIKVADMVNHPNHYAGKIEVIDYIRDKLTVVGFTEYCCGNVLKYISRWRKKDGVQDLKKARVYLDWMIENAQKEQDLMIKVPGDEQI